MSFDAEDRRRTLDLRIQALLRDTNAPGLRVRVAAAGAKSYVLEAKLKRQSVRRTIGEVWAWSIEGARAEAHRLRVLLDGGIDPRQLDRQLDRQQEAEADERKAAWKLRCVAELHKAAATGGEPKKRSKGTTKPGHLAALMPLPLASIDQDTIRDWYKLEGKTAPIQAARAASSFDGKEPSGILANFPRGARAGVVGVGRRCGGKVASCGRRFGRCSASSWRAISQERQHRRCVARPYSAS